MACLVHCVQGIYLLKLMYAFICMCDPPSSQTPNWSDTVWGWYRVHGDAKSLLYLMPPFQSMHVINLQTKHYDNSV